MTPRDRKKEMREIQSVRFGMILDYHGAGLMIKRMALKGFETI